MNPEFDCEDEATMVVDILRERMQEMLKQQKTEKGRDVCLRIIEMLEVTEEEGK